MIHRVSGFELDVDDASGVIKKITQLVQTVCLDQRVLSNGRTHVPKGTLGTVVRIEYPYIAGRTSDVLVVRWDGRSEVSSTKMKDIVCLESMPSSELPVLS